MMQPAEIIAAINWAEDTDPMVRQSIEDAIYKLGGGNNRPTFNEIEVYRRLEAFIEGHGSANKAAAALGISKSFLHDMRHSKRPYTDDVLAAIGVERVRSHRQFRAL
jgi:hypothetical protein